VFFIFFLLCVFHTHTLSCKKKKKQEPVAIGELRLTQFNDFDLAEVKHEINVLK
jgi:hypothetical protein